jgi:hypothetical protein
MQSRSQAFLIIAHHDLPAINNLIRQIASPKNLIYVHLDKKSDIKISEIDASASVFKKFNVKWGKFSQVAATMFLADTAINRGASRITLLSGVCHPIVSKNQLEQLIESEFDYFESFSIAMGGEQYNSSWMFKFWVIPGVSNDSFISKFSNKMIHKFGLGNTSFFLNSLEPRKGAQWWSVNTETYLKFRQIIETHFWMKFYFRHTFTPDERIFATLFQRIPGKHLNRSLTFARWTNGIGPLDLREEDIEVAHEQGYMFVRKISSTNSKMRNYINKKPTSE